MYVCMCVYGAYYLGRFCFFFLKLLTMVAGVSLLLPTIETPFLLLGCLVQPQYESFYLVLQYFVLSCLAAIS